MKDNKTSFSYLVERLDIVGWLSITIAIIWLLLDVFNITPPWLAENFHQAVLFVLGFLAIYSYRILTDIRTLLVQQDRAELIIGHEKVYQVATELIQRSPRQARYWATSFRFHHHIPEEIPTSQRPFEVRYFQTLKAKLQTDPEAEYRHACSATTKRGWELIKRRMADLLMVNTRQQYYYSNPLVFDCLIGETEAILAFPDRRAFPHLRAAIHIHDSRMVDVLRQWYQDFVWDSPVQKVEISSVDDLAKIEEQLSRKSFQDSAV